MPRPQVAIFSNHAFIRSVQREVPSYVLQAFIDNKAFIAQGFYEDQLQNYHIVRTGEDEYYVAIERDSVAVTIVRVDKSFPWFAPRLQNFEKIYPSIKAAKVFYDPSVKKEKKNAQRRRKNNRTKKLSDITSELKKLYNVE